MSSNNEDNQNDITEEELSFDEEDKKFLIDEEYDNLNYEINFKDDSYDFKTEVLRSDSR